MSLWAKSKGEEKQPAAAAAPGAGSAEMPASRRQETAPQAGARVGIDHAIQLIRSLPTEKNVTLVVTVLKTTLESLGIRVADIVRDAVQRQQELEARVAQFKGEIQSLEKEIEQRVQEITRLEAAHAETTRVRDYLESEPIDLVADEDSRPTTAM